MFSAWAGLASAGLCAHARADATPGDPFAYDLRFAITPLAFQAALSQSWFGSAARIEYGPFRFVDILVDGRISWLPANRGGELAHSYTLRAGFAFHVAQSLSERALYGTVYPADTPAVSAGSVGTDRDLIDLPINERLRTGLDSPHDRDLTLVAVMRDAHSLRVGAAYTRLLERARPEGDRVVQNELPFAYLGYSFATHWNLPASLTGKREVGYRRFYGDLLVTQADLIESSRERTSKGQRISSQTLGARIGMQGAMEGLTHALPSLGLAYDLEIGMYPGRSGLEGYLFLALGVAIDVATR